jgi:hypothetical protein
MQLRLGYGAASSDENMERGLKSASTVQNSKAANRMLQQQGIGGYVPRMGS